MNIKKTKIMTNTGIRDFRINGEAIEVVRSFQLLGVTLTEDGLNATEVKRRIGMGRSTMTGLTKIWKDNNIQLTTQVRLVKALVFPVELYGWESWVLRKEDRRNIDALQLWCWRRMLRVS